MIEADDYRSPDRRRLDPRFSEEHVIPVRLDNELMVYIAAQAWRDQTSCHRVIEKFVLEAFKKDQSS